MKITLEGSFTILSLSSCILGGNLEEDRRAFCRKALRIDRYLSSSRICSYAKSVNMDLGKGLALNCWSSERPWLRLVGTDWVFFNFLRGSGTLAILNLWGFSAKNFKKFFFCFSITVWKFCYFHATQILREINFCASGILKSANLTVLAHLKFGYSEFFSFCKVEFN